MFIKLYAACTIIIVLIPRAPVYNTICGVIFVGIPVFCHCYQGKSKIMKALCCSGFQENAIVFLFPVLGNDNGKYYFFKDHYPTISV